VDSYYYLEVKKMPIVLVTLRHSPENCASFNEEARKATLALLSQQEELMKKYSTKPLGGWVVSNEHLVIWVVEVPSLDTMQQFMMEPVMVAQSAFNTIEVKIATSIEESTKLLLQQG
jgi:hypothetical protein